MKSKVSDAIISHGAYLEECTVENAIVGLRSRIGKNVTIRVCASEASLFSACAKSWARSNMYA